MYVEQYNLNQFSLNPTLYANTHKTFMTLTIPKNSYIHQNSHKHKKVIEAGQTAFSDHYI